MAARRRVAVTATASGPTGRRGAGARVVIRNVEARSHTLLVYRGCIGAHQVDRSVCRDHLWVV